MMDLSLPCPPCRRAVPSGARALLWRGHPGAAAAVPADEQPLRRVGSLLPVRGRHLGGRLPAGPSPTQGWRASCLFVCVSILSQRRNYRTADCRVCQPHAQIYQLSSQGQTAPPSLTTHTQTRSHDTLPCPCRSALYSVLGSPELFRSTKAPLFLSLLFKVGLPPGGCARAAPMSPAMHHELSATSAPRLGSLDAVCSCYEWHGRTGAH